MNTLNELEKATILTTDDVFEILKNHAIEDCDFRLRKLDSSILDLMHSKYEMDMDEINKRLEEFVISDCHDQFQLYNLCEFVKEPNNEFLINLLKLTPYAVFSLYFTNQEYDQIYNTDLIDEVLNLDKRNFIYLRRVNLRPEVQLHLAEKIGADFIGLAKDQTIEAQLVAFEHMTYLEKLNTVHESSLFDKIIFKENYDLCDMLNTELLSIVIKTAYIMVTHEMYNSLYPQQSNKFLDYYKEKDPSLYKRALFELSISEEGKTIGHNILPF